MSVKHKIAAMVGVAVLTLSVLIVFGWQTLRGTTRSLDSIVNDQFLVLIDKELTPLIADDMLPLINDDVTHIENLRKSIDMMLQADRGVHQAVIAEKMALVAAEETELQAASQRNLEAVEQAAKQMQSATAYFNSPQTKQLYQKFEEAFALWKDKTRNVIELAHTPSKLKFARKSSDGGTAYTAFNAMREAIDGDDRELEHRVEHRPQERAAAGAEIDDTLRAEPAQRAEHARRAVGQPVRAVDVVGPGEQQAFLRNRLALMLEQLGVVAENRGNAVETGNCSSHVYTS